jgi:hypothetical protein
MEMLKGWLPIAISLVVLLVGGAGWWQYLFQRRQLKQERCRDLLQKFLEPLDGILKRNKAAFDRLQKGHEQEVHRLEYYPQKLKAFFDSLPDSDPRKVFWRVEIDNIQAENQKAAALIDTFIGSALLNSTFKDACTLLLNHISTWRSRWNYALSGIPIPPALENELLADVFPKVIEIELRDQIQQIRKMAHV